MLAHARAGVQTEKSMAELNVEYNKSFEFDKITEAGSELVRAAAAPRPLAQQMLDR